MSRAKLVIEKLFRIYNKQGVLVDFILNDIQLAIDREVIEPIERFRDAHGSGVEIPFEMQECLKNSVLKYRQGGVTTFIMAWFLVCCMYDYAVCVMLTHDREHSERLLERAKLMLKHMRGPKPQTRKVNDNEISFAKTDAVFYIGTAGSKEFGRSATITHLHCSEIAFWKNVASLMKSLFQAVSVGTGVIIQETTANGWGNWFQTSYYEYLKHRGGFRPWFFPWFIHGEYVSSRPFIWDEVPPGEHKYERALYKRIRKITKRSPAYVKTQLQWRRDKINENVGDRDRKAAIRDFNQEYPSTVEEAFTLTGGSLFGNLVFRSDPNWTYDSEGAFILKGHPRAGCTYAVGGDFAGGTGNDESSLVVLCLETKEQVYEFGDAYIDPVAFAEHFVKTAKRFNEAFIVPEINAHGLAGVVIIKRNYPLHRIYKHIINKGFSNGLMNVPSYGCGWKTTEITKPYMIGVANQFFKAGYCIHSPELMNQLRSFVEDPETHKMGGQGVHDDKAIAFMLSCIGVLKLLRVVGEHVLDTPPPTVGTLEVKAEEVEVANDQIPPLKVGGRKAPTSHRNEQGQYLIPFNELFNKPGSNRRRCVHVKG